MPSQSEIGHRTKPGLFGFGHSYVGGTSQTIIIIETTPQMVWEEEEEEKK